jgi:hypothetical protein
MRRIRVQQHDGSFNEYVSGPLSIVRGQQSVVRNPPNTAAKFIASSQRLIALLKWRRKPADKGLGDTVARLAGGKSGKRFAQWAAAHIGRQCGCADAQNWLNQLFPY